MDAADQNTEFVVSEPTKNPDDDFPEDGDPRHVGDDHDYFGMDIISVIGDCSCLAS